MRITQTHFLLNRRVRTQVPSLSVLRALTVRLVPVALVALLLGGCAGSKFTVVKSANPNPFLHQKEFVVDSIRYIDLKVDNKTENEFLAEKKTESALGWAADKMAINTVYRQTLIERALRSGITIRNSPTTESFIIRPSVSWVETGYYRIPAYRAVTRIKMTVDILDSKGVILDQLLLEDGVPFDVANPSTGGRLRSAAKALGDLTVDYINRRTKD